MCPLLIEGETIAMETNSRGFSWEWTRPILASFKLLTGIDAKVGARS